MKFMRLDYGVKIHDYLNSIVILGSIITRITENLVIVEDVFHTVSRKKSQFSLITPRFHVCILHKS